MRKRRPSLSAAEKEEEIRRPKIAFKKVAGTLVALAILVALVNVGMNLFASYTMTRLQLDMSPNSDRGFHQPAAASADEADPWADAFAADGEAQQLPRMAGRRVDKMAPYVNLKGVNPKFRPQGPRVIDEKDEVATDCPGLCPPRHLNVSQLVFVTNLLEHLMSPFPAASFKLQESVKGSDRRAVPPLRGPLSGAWERLRRWQGPRRLGVPHGDWGDIVAAVTTAKILAASAPRKGTQLKAMLQLQGDAWALWKPRQLGLEDRVPGDTPYSGPDRHNGEIAAFHIAALLNISRVPVAVGRRLSIKDELEASADASLSASFWTDSSSRRCFFGACRNCDRDHSVCAEPDGGLDGTIVLWLPAPIATLSRVRSPWARTYDAKRTAPWELDSGHCAAVRTHAVLGAAPLFLDLMEAAALDWLTGNADRHRLEFLNTSAGPSLVLLDNGKSFGDPRESREEPSILAPLYQCCRLRRRFYGTLLREAESSFAQALDERLRGDPLYPILSTAHLQALNRRLRKLVLLIGACIERHGEAYVLQDDGF